MRWLIYSCVAAVFFIFTACTKNDVTSREVAHKFLKAYTSYKFDEAKKYATSGTQQMLEVTSSLRRLAPVNDMQVMDVEILECFEKGNEATVVYCYKGMKDKQVIHLVKKNDNWLVGKHD